MSADVRHDFLDRDISEIAGSLLAAELPDRDAIASGARIGGYRVLHELGRGGMGVVYLAERDGRAAAANAGRVALKILRHDMEMDETSLRRFREERRILASLQHPGIARLFDEGVTDDGRPWFAMEFVDGIPIDVYASLRGLVLPARLELFARVCDAVEHAHSQSIIHRDLKPSNVLVDVAGNVRLLDFGIAKATSPLGEGVATRTGQGRLTPEYASPEQLRGLRVTPASDVFALGVLLYKLLTGRRPFRTRRCGLGALLDRLGLQPPRLGDGFPPALDAITRKALQRKPEHRYATAGAFAAHVRAALSQFPARQV